jgi:hypothetical protein
MMLPGVVPGIREVRAPLASGAIWFVTAYLVVAAQSPALVASGPTSPALQSLAGFIGRPGTVGAAVLAAFVLGTVNNSLITWFVRNRVHGLHARNPEPDTAVYDRYPNKLFKAMSAASKRRAFRRGYNTALAAHSSTRPSDSVSPEVHDQATVVAHQVVRELLYVSPRLIIARPESFGEYSRLRAEAEVRMGVGPPLLALPVAVAMSVDWPVLAEIGTFVACTGLAAMFFVQSLSTDRTARSMVAHTVGEGLITTAALDYVVAAHSLAEAGQVLAANDDEAVSGDSF